MTADHADTLKRELEQLRKPNVWFDLASIACNTHEHAPYRWARKYLQIAKDVVGANRLIWGSDAPTTLSDYPYSEAQDVILDADVFTEPELIRIFQENAKAAYSIK